MANFLRLRRLELIVAISVACLCFLLLIGRTPQRRPVMLTVSGNLSRPVRADLRWDFGDGFKADQQIPLVLRPRQQPLQRGFHEVVIERVGKRNLRSKGNEVWIDAIILDGYKRIPLNELQNSGTLLRAPRLVLVKDGAKIRFRRRFQQIGFLFVMHGHSGLVRISVDGKVERERDLYAADSQGARVSVRIKGHRVPGLIAHHLALPKAALRAVTLTVADASREWQVRCPGCQVRRQQPTIATQPTLSIERSGLRRKSAKGAEVWLQRVVVDGQVVPLQSRAKPGATLFLHGRLALVRDGAAVALRRRFSTAQLQFYTHEHSGKVRLRLNGQPLLLHDLYAPNQPHGRWITLTVKRQPGPSPQPRWCVVANAKPSQPLACTQPSPARFVVSQIDTRGINWGQTSVLVLVALFLGLISFGITAWIRNPRTIPLAETPPTLLARVFQPRRVFLAVGGVFGLLFLVITPPMQAPDAPNHFFRAYQLSEGEFLGDRFTIDSQIGGRHYAIRAVGAFLPRNLLYTTINSSGRIWENPTLKFDRKILEPLWSQPLGTDQRVFYNFCNTTVYPPLSYAPQIATISVARALGLSPLKIGYAVRLMTWLSWLLLVYFAIRLIPVGKWSLMLVALLPMSTYMASSVSQDGVINGVVYLFAAYALRLALDDPNRPLTRGNLWILGLMAMVVSIVFKGVFFLLPAGVMLLLPWQRFGSRRRYWVSVLSIVGICAVVTLSWTATIRPIMVPREDFGLAFREGGYTGDTSLQLRYVLNHPIAFIRTILRTWAFKAYYLESFVGRLGWLDVYLPHWLIIFALGVLGLNALVDGPSPSWGARRRLLLAGIFFGALSLIHAALYLTWSPVSDRLVDGGQGRYLLSIAPFLLWGLGWSPQARERLDRVRGPLVTAAAIVVLTIALVLLTRRYYG